jgi:hypothetical protein
VAAGGKPFENLMGKFGSSDVWQRITKIILPLIHFFAFIP